MPIDRKMPSSMTHTFSQVPEANIPRSVFNRVGSYKTTFNAGDCIPWFVDEALPGDTFNFNAILFARQNTPVVPFMDNLYLDTFYFAIPHRLVWNNWEKFCGAQTDPDDSTDFTIPQMPAPTTTGFPQLGLADYFGIRILVDDITVNALPFRAYNLVWNEWFRDQNLQDSVVVDKDDGPDTPGDYVILKRGKRHDYFTSCLPWPQKGPGVELPLGDTAPIILNPESGAIEYWRAIKASDGTPPAAGNIVSQVTSGQLQGSAASDPLALDPRGALVADLSSATASTINSLRQAFQIQKLYERDARGGTRYTEIVRSHFGVISPDARLQRPEFLGGNSTPIMITPVAQTATLTTADNNAVGNLGAYGTVVSQREGFTKSFTEHCIILGILCVRADLSYQQGIPRMFSRETRWDYYWPALATIGEQAVLNKEIFAQGTAADDDVFGYQERWAEYRYFHSKITGWLRSDSAESLDYWHLAQDFASLPTLSSTFISEDVPVARVSAITEDRMDFTLDSHIKIRTVRPMPVYSVPGLIDHF